MSPRMQHLRAGFTMIELLVVIVILGVLISTFSYSTMSARENARIAKATAESRELANAIRLFCITQNDQETSSTDPMATLGLSEGLTDANNMTVLTTPSERNGNTVYFNANAKSVDGRKILDPWNHPYKIRVRKISPSVDPENDFVIITPIEARHRALEPIQ